MSVNNILDGNNKILSTYLPAGSSNNYVDNPMAENLQGANFNITNVNIVQCDRVSLAVPPEELITPNSPAQPTYTGDAVGSILATFPVLTINDYYTCSITYSSAGNAIGVVSIQLEFDTNPPITVLSAPAAFWNSSAGTINTLNFTVRAQEEACDISFFDAGGIGAEIIIYENVVYQAV